MGLTGTPTGEARNATRFYQTLRAGRPKDQEGKGGQSWGILGPRGNRSVDEGEGDILRVEMLPSSRTVGNEPHPETQHVQRARPPFPLQRDPTAGLCSPCSRLCPHLPQLPCLDSASHARTQPLTLAQGKRGGPRRGEHHGHRVGSHRLKQSERAPSASTRRLRSYERDRRRTGLAFRGLLRDAIAFGGVAGGGAPPTCTEPPARWALSQG